MKKIGLTSGLPEEKAAFCMEKMKDSGQEPSDFIFFLAEVFKAMAPEVTPYLKESCGVGLYKKPDGNISVVSFEMEGTEE